MTDKQMSAKAISALQRVAQAVHPHAAWGIDDKQDELIANDGTTCAVIRDYLLLIYHSNGNRSHWAYDNKNDEPYCFDLHKEQANDNNVT